MTTTLVSSGVVVSGVQVISDSILSDSILEVLSSGARKHRPHTGVAADDVARRNSHETTGEYSFTRDRTSHIHRPAA